MRMRLPKSDAEWLAAYFFYAIVVIVLAPTRNAAYVLALGPMVVFAAGYLLLMAFMVIIGLLNGLFGRR